MKIDIDKYMKEKEYYQLGQEDERKIINMKVGFLRQFLNERQPAPLTSEDIRYWLGMATIEEVEESHKKESAIMDKLITEISDKEVVEYDKMFPINTFIGENKREIIEIIQLAEKRGAERERARIKETMSKASGGGSWRRILEQTLWEGTLSDEDIKNLITKAIQLEDHNFKIDPYGWSEIKVDGRRYLEAPTKDIWEILEGDERGEQLFTWEAAMRETKKAGKRLPTDEELSKCLKTKDDLKNISFPGYRSAGGLFYGQGSDARLWSSSVSGSDAWRRGLGSGDSTVNRGTHSQSLGFSVRCVKE